MNVKSFLFVFVNIFFCYGLELENQYSSERQVPVLVGGSSGKFAFDTLEAIPTVWEETCVLGPTLPEQVVGGATAFVADALYYCGGYSFVNRANLADCYAKDFTDDDTPWRKIASMNEDRRMACGFVRGGDTFYVLGGQTGDGEYSRTAERLVGGSWTMDGDLAMDEGRFDMCCAVLRDRLHVFGGTSRSDGGRRVARFDGQRWEALASTPFEMPTATCAAIGDEVYAMTANFKWDSGSTRLARYDVQGDSWTELSPLLRSVSYGRLVASDGIPVLVGGYLNMSYGTTLNTIYYYKDDKWNSSRKNLSEAKMDAVVAMVPSSVISKLCDKSSEFDNLF